MGLKSRVRPALFCSPDVYVRAGRRELCEFGEYAIALINFLPFGKNGVIVLEHKFFSGYKHTSLGAILEPVAVFVFGRKLGDLMERRQCEMLADEPKLRIIRRFAVSADTVFDALTNPPAMKIWWGDDAIIETDLRVGGRWRITRQEDGVEYVAVGEFLAIEWPFRLIYTFGMPQFSPNSDTISFEIKADESGCVVTFEQSGEDTVTELSELPPGTVSQSEAGWRQGLDLMAAAWERG
jgi:uncharacterized protein YndB with AHSA1/START domain